MELLLNGEPTEQEPDAEFLREWFRKEHDRGDFLILRDVVFGELRATAPERGLCLVQAEGAATDALHAEAELPRLEAAQVFAQFLARDTSFRVAFEHDAHARAFSWLGWLFGVLAAAVAWWVWYQY